MRGVLVDTGPLIGLFDERDALHHRALQEARSLTAPALVGIPVLTEALHFLRETALRARLGAAFERGTLRLVSETEPEGVADALRWMGQYEEHDPDFVDAHLVAWAARDPGLSIWTFDSEFRAVWRTLKGARVRLARLRATR